MVCDSAMMDAEGMRVYTCTVYTSHRRAGLTCPERDGGEKEIAYWETGDGRETVWDICIIHKWVERNRTCLYDNVLPQKPHDDTDTSRI